MTRFAVGVALVLFAGATLRAGEMDAEFGRKGPGAGAKPAARASVEGVASADARAAGVGTELDREGPVQAWCFRGFGRFGYGGFGGFGLGYGGFGFGRGFGFGYSPYVGYGGYGFSSVSFGLGGYGYGWPYYGGFGYGGFGYPGFGYGCW